MGSVTEDLIQSALNELTKQSDRGAAIIGAAIVDDVLTEVLQLRLILTKTHKERLFSYEKNGPLAHFSAKIDVAFAVGLISSATRDKLHLVRRIRNRFAHHVEAIEFSDSKVTAFCHSLKLHDPKTKEPRRRYMVACLELLGVLAVLRQLAGLRIAYIAQQPEAAAQLDEFTADLQKELARREKAKPGS